LRGAGAAFLWIEVLSSAIELAARGSQVTDGVADDRYAHRNRSVWAPHGASRCCGVDGQVQIEAVARPPRTEGHAVRAVALGLHRYRADAMRGDRTRPLSPLEVVGVVRRPRLARVGLVAEPRWSFALVRGRDGRRVRGASERPTIGAKIGAVHRHEAIARGVPSGSTRPRIVGGMRVKSISADAGVTPGSEDSGYRPRSSPL
jgi:hypothetical protein